MRNPLLLTFCCLTALAATSHGASAAIRHDFVAIDEGLSNLMRVDEANPARNWLVHIGKEHPRDMQLIGQGRLLISHDAGYQIYDLSTGRLLKDVSRYHDVSSARYLPDGHILLVGVDFDREKKNKGDNPIGDPTGRHVIFGEYTPDDHQVRRTAYAGDYARLVRETSEGTFLCSCNQKFLEGDANGTWIRQFPVPGFYHAWKALRLPNGDTLMSAGYGTTQDKKAALRTSFMVEVDPQGRVVRRFGAADQVPPEVHPFFYANFQLLQNGDVVVANWQGHKAGHNYQGEQLLEFDQRGRIVWQWSDRAFVSSVQGVLVLDGLDPSLPYDERRGVMEPLR